MTGRIALPCLRRLVTIGHEEPALRVCKLAPVHCDVANGNSVRQFCQCTLPSKYNLDTLYCSLAASVLGANGCALLVAQLDLALFCKVCMAAGLIMHLRLRLKGACWLSAERAEALIMVWVATQAMCGRSKRCLSIQLACMCVNFVVTVIRLNCQQELLAAPDRQQQATGWQPATMQKGSDNHSKGMLQVVQDCEVVTAFSLDAQTTAHVRPAICYAPPMSRLCCVAAL